MARKSGTSTVVDVTTKALYDLLKTKKLEDITILELTEKAGIARVSYYRNFGSKEEIVRRDLHRKTEQFVRESGIHYENTEPKKYFESLFQHLLDHRELFQLLIDAELIGYLKDEFDRAFMRPHTLKSQQYADCLVAGACYNLAYYWFTSGVKETPHQMAEIITSKIRFL